MYLSLSFSLSFSLTWKDWGNIQDFHVSISISLLLNLYKSLPQFLLSLFLTHSLSHTHTMFTRLIIVFMGTIIDVLLLFTPVYHYIKTYTINNRSISLSLSLSHTHTLSRSFSFSLTLFNHNFSPSIFL